MTDRSQIIDSLDKVILSLFGFSIAGALTGGVTFLITFSGGDFVFGSIRIPSRTAGFGLILVGVAGALSAVGLRLLLKLVAADTDHSGALNREFSKSAPEKARHADDANQGVREFYERRDRDRERLLRKLGAAGTDHSGALNRGVSKSAPEKARHADDANQGVREFSEQGDRDRESTVGTSKEVDSGSYSRESLEKLPHPDPADIQPQEQVPAPESDQMRRIQSEENRAPSERTVPPLSELPDPDPEQKRED